MGGGAGVLAEESANGAVDVWSSSPREFAGADHLVVMVHGILGSVDNWKFAAGQFVKMMPDKVVVHCMSSTRRFISNFHVICIQEMRFAGSEKNMYKLTLDGVDVMGRRLAEEVAEVIERNLQFRKISFIAHSVGGLVARYAVGVLFRLPRTNSKEACGTIHGLEGINFITVATPHLGSRGNKQVPCLLGNILIENFASQVVHLIFGRTGKHLFLTDDDDGNPPLLLRLVDDNQNGFYFISALRAFKRRVVYANATCDHIVGWRTSSIRRNLELPKCLDSWSEVYPHILNEEQTEAENPSAFLHTVDRNGDHAMTEEKMIAGLRRVSWERVDVSFQGSKQSFVAHSIIQVKDPFLHSEGADVIQHMMDNFLT